MSQFESPDEQNEQAGIQVDLYGIKTKIQPTETDEPPPRTWKETLAGVNHHLMRLTRDIVGFVADVPTKGREVLRGIATMPAAVARRVAGAHQQADRREDRRQDELETGAAPLPPASEAASALEDKLLALRAQGYAVELRKLGQGRWEIAIVRPEHLEHAHELAQQALPELGAPNPVTQSRTVPIEELGLSARPLRCIQQAGIRTTDDLASLTAGGLLSLPGFGPASLTEVHRVLSERGLTLRDDKA